MMRFPIALALLAISFAAPAQQPITTPGTVAHQGAGTGFPERVGEFRRGSVTSFDAERRNVAASYNWHPPGGRVLITVYIYPAPPAAPAGRAAQCRNQFDQAQQALTFQHKEARAVEQGAAPPMDGVEPDLGHRSVFRFRTVFGSTEEDVRSEVRLYCYVGGDWLVKYRVTAHASLDAGAAIESFVRVGPWPGRPAPEQVVALPASGPAL
jgi:hypothetical protein